MKSNKGEKINIVITLLVAFVFGWWGKAQGIDFARMDLSPDYGPLLVERVNELRNAPLAYAEAVGLDPGDVAARFDGVSLAPLLGGLPALELDPILTNVARLHFSDMIENLYFDHYDLLGRSPGERMEAVGMRVSVWDEAMVGLAFPNVIDPDTALNYMFQELVRSALLLEGEGSSLLDPFVTKVGVYFSGGTMLIAGEYYNVYFLIIETARPVSSSPKMDEIAGRLYVDKNGNGRFEPGEALSGCELWFEGPVWKGFSPYEPSQTYVVHASPSGNFYLDVPPGEYEYKAACEAGSVVSGIVEVSGDVYLDLGQVVAQDMDLNGTPRGEGEEGHFE